MILVQLTSGKLPAERSEGTSVIPRRVALMKGVFEPKWDCGVLKPRAGALLDLSISTQTADLEDSTSIFVSSLPYATLIWLHCCSFETHHGYCDAATRLPCCPVARGHSH